MTGSAPTERYDAIHAHAGYALDPARAVLLSIDFQPAFGELEPVPDAQSALTQFVRVASAWRAVGGLVMHVRIYFSEDQGPGRLIDFAPGVAAQLAEGAPMAAFYDGLVEAGDIVLRKTRFSAVAGGDLLSRLAERGIDTVIVGGLTTPICVQSTVDDLQMTGHRVIVIEDACAAQPIGPFSARDAHWAAIERMRYIMARVIDAKGALAELATVDA